jgi:hypothetical protein
MNQLEIHTCHVCHMSATGQMESLIGPHRACRCQEFLKSMKRYKNVVKHASDRVRRITEKETLNGGLRC